MRHLSYFGSLIASLFSTPMLTFNITCDWDDEAKVWTVVESDVPGLAAEAPTEEAMAELLNHRIPELLELNQHLLARTPAARKDRSVEFELTTRRRERIPVAACG